MSNDMVYLDYNATTPTDRRVTASMLPVFEEKFGNPSSDGHNTGRVAVDLVEEARASVAKIIGMKSADVIFTSGATEANNLVFFGFAKEPLHILVGSTEHKSVLEPCRFLSNHGAIITKIPVLSNGTIDLVTLKKELSEDIDLISIMAANSETGVINPIKKITEMAHEYNIFVHCDATQAVGKIPFYTDNLDMITFSSHKIYGPKGCGALVATRQVRKQMRAVLYGGGQENNIRSGTLNVPGIVGFGKACEIAREEITDSSRQEKLRDYLEAGIMKSISNVTINGKDADRLPNTSNIRIKGALADAIIVNAREIEISSGSACASAAMEPSHVLTAMGLDTDAANESIRISLGRQTTQHDIDIAIDAITKAVHFVRSKEAEISRGQRN